jgi:hypothetical protein
MSLVQKVQISHQTVSVDFPCSNPASCCPFVVNRHRFDADPDPNSNFDADPHPDPNPSIIHVGKFFRLLCIAVPVYMVCFLSVSYGSRHNF